MDHRTLQSIAISIIGKSCDPKDITLWDHYINKGGFSLDDFKDYLFKSPEFASHVEQEYEKQASELGGGVPGFAAFWAQPPKEWIDAGVKSAIHKFLADTPEFANKYKRIIGDVYSYETDGSLLSDSQLGFYLDKFASNPDYDVVLLAADIQRGAHVEEMRMPQHGSGSIGGGGSNGSGGGDGIGSGGNNGSNSVATQLFDVSRLDAFESVFRRPMFVQEYFKYVDSGSDSGGGKSWLELYNEHNELYNRMRKIFETYTGKTISEYYYVNRFLFSVDNPDFFDRIVDDIVTSPEYKSGMVKVLGDRYNAMFDLTMTDMDIEYIFEIVKNQKLDIVNENIATILTNLKNETDTIVSAIFKVFASVLDRPPDMNEIEQYVVYYRNGGVDIELEKILMRTLEFHDSIKKRIRGEYLAAKGKDILPSILFDILNRIIVKIDDITMNTINGAIKDLLV